MYVMHNTIHEVMANYSSALGAKSFGRYRRDNN